MNKRDVLSHISTDERNKAQDNAQTLPDGSFPIRNIKDLSNAIKSFGLSKNPAQAKAWIMKRAKELNAENMLPKQWLAHGDEDGETFYPYSPKALYHHGILGMKWGHHKADGGSVTTAKESGRSSRKEVSDDAARSKSIKAKGKAKGTDSLSNSELQARIQRLQLEKQYKDLSKHDVSPGQKFATDVLSSTGKQILSQQLSKYATKGVEAGVEALAKKAAAGAA